MTAATTTADAERAAVRAQDLCPDCLTHHPVGPCGGDRDDDDRNRDSDEWSDVA